MRCSRRHSRRRGAALVEAAIVTPVFVILVIGMIDLGLAVWCHNTMSFAAREGARQAIVHGELAPAATTGWTGPWGPSELSTDLSDTSGPAGELAEAVAILRHVPLQNTEVTVTWLNGNNRPGSPLQATVTAEYQPVLTSLFGSTPIPLTASSTLIIAH